MKQTNILWTGREYYSLENCLIQTTAAGWEISSAIIGYYNQKIYKAEYRIQTNLKWEVLSAEIISRCGVQTESVKLEKNGRDTWQLNGKSDERFNDCIDVDVPLTPFTNSLLN